MKRKTRSKKSGRGGRDIEEEHQLLLNESDTASDTNNNSISTSKELVPSNRKPVGKRFMRRLDSKINMFAPEACDSRFEDVPVMTVCPSCRAKVVTKTSHSKKKPCCLCCCSQEFLSLFKPIRHKCPKCNYKIAKYSRFGFNFKSNQTVYDKEPPTALTKKEIPMIEEAPKTINSPVIENKERVTKDNSVEEKKIILADSPTMGKNRSSSLAQNGVSKDSTKPSSPFPKHEKPTKGSKNSSPASNVNKNSSSKPSSPSGKNEKSATKANKKLHKKQSTR